MENRRGTQRIRAQHIYKRHKAEIIIELRYMMNQLRQEPISSISRVEFKILNFRHVNYSLLLSGFKISLSQKTKDYVQKSRFIRNIT